MFSEGDLYDFITLMKNLTRYTFVFLMLLTGWAFAGGDKNVAQITFHLETQDTQNPKMIFPCEIAGQQKFFLRSPEISSKDFVAFSPFPSEDQVSYGVLIQLKDSSGKRLTAVTTANPGKMLTCQAFGRLVDTVIIDKPVNDRAIVVWKGLTLEEIRELDKTMPRIGEKKK